MISFFNFFINLITSIKKGGLRFDEFVCINLIKQAIMPIKYILIIIKDINLSVYLIY
jgi:hypothetical protein